MKGILLTPYVQQKMGNKYGHWVRDNYEVRVYDLTEGPIHLRLGKVDANHRIWILNCVRWQLIVHSPTGQEISTVGGFLHQEIQGYSGLYLCDTDSSRLGRRRGKSHKLRMPVREVLYV